MEQVFQTETIADPEYAEVEPYLKFELDFWEVLLSIVEKTTVKLNIPETFISAKYILNPILMYTDHNSGEVQIRRDVGLEGIQASLDFFNEYNGKGVPLAVSKTMVHGRDTWRILLTAQEAVDSWVNISRLGQPQILQRYVQSYTRRGSVVHLSWSADQSQIKKVVYKNQPPIVPIHNGQTESRFSLASQPRLPRLFPQHWNNDPYKAVGTTVIRQNIATSTGLDALMEYVCGLIEMNWLPGPEFKLSFLNLQIIKDLKGIYYLINIPGFGISYKNKIQYNKKASKQITRSESEKRIRPMLTRNSSQASILNDQSMNTSLHNKSASVLRDSSLNTSSNIKPSLKASQNTRSASSLSRLPVPKIPNFHRALSKKKLILRKIDRSKLYKKYLI